MCFVKFPRDRRNNVFFFCERCQVCVDLVLHVVVEKFRQFEYFCFLLKADKGNYGLRIGHHAELLLRRPHLFVLQNNFLIWRNSSPPFSKKTDDRLTLFKTNGTTVVLFLQDSLKYLKSHQYRLQNIHPKRSSHAVL